MLVRALCAEIDPLEAIGTFETEYELHLHELKRHRIVHPFAPYVDARFMAECRARGLTVNVWTWRDTEAELTRLLALDVDGIITGDPALTLRLLGR